MSDDALDLFAGCGGASLGLDLAGLDVIGVEVWEDAVRTHEAAGLPCTFTDVRMLDPRQYVGISHLHGSPPCTTFSQAGAKNGRLHVEDLALAVKKVLRGEPHGLDDPDETTLLTLEPARYIAATLPATVSLEQVRAVLPIWEAYADGLGELGYSVATGIISSETLGVPQTRARAWLAARRDGKVARLPEQTHSRYYPKHPDRVDPGFPAPVAMADVLDLDEWPYVCAAGITGDSVRSTSKASPTITGARTAYLIRKLEDYVGRGATDYEKSGRLMRSSEALLFQGFPADFPLYGNEASRFRQVGNAVPPAVARSVVEELRS